MDDKVTIGGKVHIDPAMSHYYGNSLGGIIGSVYMAATADVSRGKTMIRVGVATLNDIYN